MTGRASEDSRKMSFSRKRGVPDHNDDDDDDGDGDKEDNDYTVSRELFQRLGSSRSTREVSPW